MTAIGDSMENVSLRGWKINNPTKAQLEYIQHIMTTSKVPLPKFTGTTRQEAAKWISENKSRAYCSNKE